MNFQNSFSIILLVSAFFTFLTSYLFLKFPPKSINWFYGYRTINSMKTKAHWNFAHMYSGKKFLIFGLILTLLGLLGSFFNLKNILGSVLAITISILGFINIILKTEKAIKRKFNSK